MTVIMVDTTTYKSIYLELVKLVENREPILEKYTIDTYKRVCKRILKITKRIA